MFVLPFKFLVFFLWTAPACCFASEGVGMIHSALSKQEIVEKLGRHWPVEASEFFHGGKHILAVTIDNGSGLSLKSLHLYVRSRPEHPWTLMAYLRSNSSSIRIETSDEGISAISKSGRKLMFIPKDSISTGYDAAEQ